MFLLRAATLAAIGLCAALPAAAGTITHGSVASFPLLEFTPGGKVAKDRSDANALFDGKVDTMRSLGLGGGLLAGVGIGQVITKITFSELTYGVWSNMREAVTVSLGWTATAGSKAPDSGHWTPLGTFRNDEWRDSAKAAPLPAVTPDAKLAKDAPNVAVSGGFDRKNVALAGYEIDIGTGKGLPHFNLILIQDVSGRAPGRDGFDIDAFQVVSQGLPSPAPAIAEPASLALLGAGLLGLLGFRRREKAAAA